MAKKKKDQGFADFTQEIDSILWIESARKRGQIHVLGEHWGIESMHYVMDVVFEEDASLADRGESAENMSLIRRLANNVIKMFDPNRGVTNARRCATYEPAYLRGLLARVFVK